MMCKWAYLAKVGVSCQLCGYLKEGVWGNLAPPRDMEELGSPKGSKGGFAPLKN
jgi:hypothetical protein